MSFTALQSIQATSVWSNATVGYTLAVSDVSNRFRGSNEVRTTPFDGDVPISSPFKAYRIINGKPNIHTGTDYRVDVGTPIHATAAGTIIRSDYSKSYGNIVIINHGSNVYTLYAHGSKRVVSVGDKVSVGQVIMLSGDTGLSTGPHTHYEVVSASYPFSYSDLSIRYSPLDLSKLLGY